MSEVIGLEANYKARVNFLKQKFGSERNTTNSKPMLMCALDCGTARGDVRIQVIVATYIDMSGYSKEIMISAANCNNGTAQGAANHFIKTSSQIFDDLKAICVLSTDGAAYYKGNKSGMITLIKNNILFNKKIIDLFDVAHKSELLIKSNMPTWVKESIDITNMFAHSLSIHATVSNTVYCQNLHLIANYIIKAKFMLCLQQDLHNMATAILNLF